MRVAPRGAAHVQVALGPITGERVARPPVCNMSRTNGDGRPSHEAVPDLIFDAPHGRPRAGQRLRVPPDGFVECVLGLAARHGREALGEARVLCESCLRVRRRAEDQSVVRDPRITVFWCRFDDARRPVILSANVAAESKISWFIFLATIACTAAGTFCFTNWSRCSCSHWSSVICDCCVWALILQRCYGCAVLGLMRAAIAIAAMASASASLSSHDCKLCSAISVQCLGAVCAAGRAQPQHEPRTTALRLSRCTSMRRSRCSSPPCLLLLVPYRPLVGPTRNSDEVDTAGDAVATSRTGLADAYAK